METIKNVIANQTNIPFLKKVLDVSSLKQKVIASNIANASTPGYKPKDIDFEKELKTFLNQSKTNGKRTNPAGLLKVGKNLFRTSANSGDAIKGIATKTISGEITSGALEMSNVDLAQEFTSMIIAQRGFQANARVITTSDDMLTDLVSLKR